MAIPGGHPGYPGGTTMASEPRQVGRMTTEHDLRVFIQQYTLARAPSWEKGRERENAFETIQDAKTVFDMIERRVEIEAEARTKREQQSAAAKAKAKYAAYNSMRVAGVPMEIVNQWMNMPDLDPSMAADVIASYAHKKANPPVVVTPDRALDELDRTIYQQITGGLTNVAKKALGNHTTRKV